MSQHANMTIAVDWDIKHQFKQTAHDVDLGLWSMWFLASSMKNIQ